MTAAVRQPSTTSGSSSARPSGPQGRAERAPAVRLPAAGGAVRDPGRALPGDRPALGRERGGRPRPADDADLPGRDRALPAASRRGPTSSSCWATATAGGRCRPRSRPRSSRRCSRRSRGMPRSWPDARTAALPRPGTARRQRRAGRVRPAAAQVDVPEGASDEQREVAEAERREWRGRGAAAGDPSRARCDALGWAEAERARRSTSASATEQEIVLGALEADGAGEHVFCFFRTITNLAAGESAQEVLRPDGVAEGTRPATRTTRARLDALSASCGDVLGSHVAGLHREKWHWRRDHHRSHRHAAGGLDDCLELLDEPERRNALQRCLAQPRRRDQEPSSTRLEPVEAVDREIAATRGSARRCRDFVGRDESVGGDRRATCGRPGSTARRHRRARLRQVGAHGEGVRAGRERASESRRRRRFIGATPGSSTAERCSATCAARSRGHTAATSRPCRPSTTTWPSSSASASSCATAERPLVVFLDALDQLGATDPARGLSWLPASPARARAAGRLDRARATARGALRPSARSRGS